VRGTNCFTCQTEWYIFQQRFSLQGPLYAACQEDRQDIIKFLLDNKADINKQTERLPCTPLHSAIHKKHLSACKLILGYDQALSDQNLEKGIEIAKLKQHLEVQAVLETEVKRRQGLVQSAHDAKPAQKICSFCKEVPEKRKKCGKCKFTFYCSRECQA
jgi:hypothetical protein